LNKARGALVSTVVAAADMPTDLERRSLLIVGSDDRRLRINSNEVRNENRIARGHGCCRAGRREPRARNGRGDQTGDQVVQWNRTLLVIVRTPGAQPAAIHPTRSFAIMHAAMYDAVNAIDGTHKPYLVRLSASHFASQEAAAAAAAHEVLVKLYPNLQAALDVQLQQALAQLASGGRADGISIGNTVADRILALRANDGSNAQPIPYVFGNAAGDYQSTPPNFPKRPQFTHWSRVTPFVLAVRQS
jgi:hypothetical protein